MRVISGLSLALCAAMIVLWLRSCSHTDVWAWRSRTMYPSFLEVIETYVTIEDRRISLSHNSARLQDWGGRAAPSGFSHWTAPSSAPPAFHWTDLLPHFDRIVKRPRRSGFGDTRNDRYLDVSLPTTALGFLVIPLFRGAHACRRWILRRGAIPACLSCGYDLRATPELCPECGAVPIGGSGPMQKSIRWRLQAIVVLMTGTLMSCGRGVQTPPHADSLKVATYPFSRRIEIEVRGPSPFPLRAVFKTLGDNVAASQVIRHGKNFVLNANLYPGTYQFQVLPSSDTADVYDPIRFPAFHIDKEGAAHFLSPFASKIEFVRKIVRLTPDDGEVVVEKRPTLRWQPLSSAASYRVRWYDTQGLDIQTPQPWYQLPQDLDDNRGYDWIVEACDDHGTVIGSGSGYFLSRGSTPPPRHGPMQPMPVFAAGIGVVNASMPFGKPTPVIVRDLSEVQLSPCVLVEGMLPRSPGIDAGLLPGDMIVAISDQPLAEHPAADFALKIGRCPQGSRVKVSFFRERASTPRTAELLLR